MATQKITAPVRYKRCIISPAPGANGYDVFDGKGRWFNVCDQRRAKWWASIHDRIESEFTFNHDRVMPEVAA